jgi:D-3-phosphoglycerate dehydrogenase
VTAPPEVRRIVVLADTVPVERLRREILRLDTPSAARFAVTSATDVPVGEDVWALVVGPERRDVTAAALERLPGLALLAATSAGTDHLPVAEARAGGVAVSRVVDYCTDEVADHTLALILGMIRQTHRLDAAVCRGRWEIGAPPPQRLDSTVVGIWGTGLIGSAVTRRVAALGMQVLTHGRHRPSPTLGANVREVGFDELVTTCDVLSVHVPLTEETRGKIDARVFGRMKPGSILVNVSRGGIVAEDDLRAALVSGRLGGAAVDVLGNEPPPPDYPLLAAPGLVVTPHAAWYSPEAALAPTVRIAHIVVEVASGRSTDHHESWSA